MSPQKRIHLKSAILALILFGLMAIFQSKHFFANKKLIDDFTKESLITYEKFLNRQFSGLEKVMNHYQNEYTQLNRFSSKEHDEIAKKFLFHLDYVLAFNYILFGASIPRSPNPVLITVLVANVSASLVFLSVSSSTMIEVLL